MIFETLAAMADYADDKKFNFSSDAAQAKTVIADARNTGAKTVIDDANAFRASRPFYEQP